MLEFKAITLQDKELFERYIKKSKFLTSEYSFLSLFIWREALDTKYCIYKDALIIKKVSNEFGSFFMQPIGYKDEDLKDIVETLIDYKIENNMEYLFRNVEAPFLDELNKVTNNRFKVGIEENNFDYIYESKNLIDLAGRKFAAKRNHITRFINNYEYKVEDIGSENIHQCIAAAKAWCDANAGDQLICYETDSIITILNNWDKLNFSGIVVYVNDKLSAFTIGEIANEEMAIIHVEKAFSEIHGLYPFINKAFVERYFKNIKYINREDDMGIEGLRKAKQSYHPTKLEYKHIIA